MESRRTGSSVRIIGTLAVLIVVALLVACGGDGGATEEPAATETAAPGGTAAPTPEDTQIDAEALYATTCATCHATGGEGGTGPDLRPLTEDDRDAIELQITQGGGAMPAFGEQLSDAQIGALAEYVIAFEQ